MTGCRTLSTVLAVAIVAAAGLAWPWPADRAPLGSIVGAQASTIRIAYPARPWYCAAPTIDCQADVVAAWQPKGAASLAASYADISGHGRTVTVPGAPAGLVAPTLGAAGWVCAGQTALDTGVVPVLGYSVLVAYTAMDTRTGYGGGLAGVQYPLVAGVGRWYLVPSHPYFAQRGYGYRDFAYVDGRRTAGVIGLAGASPYLDGLPDGAAVAGSGDLPALSSWLCSIRLRAGEGSPDEMALPAYGTLSAAAIWSRTLTAAEMAAVSAAMAAL